MVSGQDKCKELERNEFGQPVGDNSVKYASFLGCMIKEFVPYTLDGWNDISKEVKDRMWSCLQEKSERFRAMRKKQDHIHTMSLRGYARLTHIMKEIQECTPESQNTTNIVDDAISLVFEKEARGRVRGMGFRVTPSKVGASVKQNGTVQQLQTMVVSGDIGSGIENEVGSNDDIEIGAKKNGNFDNVSQSNLRNVSLGDIRANTKCKVLHWCADELVVAEGRIASTDPNTKVHHVVLGRYCWKVWVDKVFVEKVDLIRPNDEMQFLVDAIGSTVAWLSKCIVLCD
ncbi:uncharacterized protein [Primulina huaijiensis]|uniref:uncharacterized protein n=1 Tax=Primulina huaijiensis TaxID=1492673 RepID=UPI003CC6FB82